MSFCRAGGQFGTGSRNELHLYDVELERGRPGVLTLEGHWKKDALVSHAAHRQTSVPSECELIQDCVVWTHQVRRIYRDPIMQVQLQVSLALALSPPSHPPFCLCPVPASIQLILNAVSVSLNTHMRTNIRTKTPGAYDDVMRIRDDLNSQVSLPPTNLFTRPLTHPLSHPPFSNRRSTPRPRFLPLLFS